MYWALFRKQVWDRDKKRLLPMLLSGKPPGMFLVSWLKHKIWPGEFGYRALQLTGRVFVAYLMYLVGSKCLGQEIGLLTAFIWGVTASVPHTRVQFSHAENWISLLAVLMFLFAPNTLVLCILVILALQFKQTALVLLLVLPFWANSIVGPIVFALVCLLITKMPWSYIKWHWTQRSWQEELSMVEKQMTVPWRELWPVLVLAAVGIPLVPVEIAIWAAVMLIVGLSQRHYAIHHFIPALPPIAILAAATLWNRWDDPLIWVICSIFIIKRLIMTFLYHLRGQSWKACHLWGPFGLFNLSAREIGISLRSRLKEDDCVLQIGDQTTVNYYCERQSPWHKQHWIYPQPADDMAEELVRCINHRRPAFIVVMAPLVHNYVTMADIGHKLKHNYVLDCVYGKQIPVYRKET